MKKILSIAAIFVVVFSTFPMPAVQGDADLLIWSTPTQLTTDPASDADPSIAYDSSGRIWVFFTSDRSGSPQIWYLGSSDQGQTWSSPQLFQPAQTPSGAHYIGETCLFEDSQDRLWSAWGRWSGSSQEDIYFSVSSDMGATWSGSRLLVSYYDVDGQPCFVQVGNNIWLIFSSYGIAGNWNIYYIETSDDGQTWSSPQGIIVDQFRHDSCSVVKDSAGKVQVFYTTLTSPYDPPSTDIWRVETSDQGVTWSVPEQVTSFPSEEGHISAVEFDGALYVFYMNRYAQDIWYVVSNDAGSTWFPSPGRVDSDSHNDQYPYAVVAGGELWVTWSSDRSGNWDVWIAHAQTIVPSATATTWTKYPANPLNLESGQLSRPWVVCEGNMYKMWYTVLAPGETAEKICFADSSDGVNWATHGAVLTGGSWDVCVLKPVVLYDGTLYKMWYLGAIGVGSPIQKVGYATSSDGVTWTKHTAPVLIPGGNGGWDDFTISTMTVLFGGTRYLMWYSAEDYSAGTTRIGVATSADGLSWTKYSNNPVLAPTPSSWESGHVWAGPVFKNRNHYEMLYTGQTRDYPGRIGLAVSVDGFSWTRYKNNPILENGPVGSWDSITVVASCITEKENNLLLWYYGSDGELVRMGLAATVMTLPAYAWYTAGHTYENTETILQGIDVDSETPGDQQVVCASPGQTISVSYTFQMWSSGGPGIIKQAWFAYSWASSWPPWDAYTPLYSGGSGGYYPGFTKTGSFTITVPTTPGKYDVWFCTEAHYSMNQAVQGLTEHPDMPPHAIIIVSTDQARWYPSKYVGHDYKVASFDKVEDWVWKNCVPLVLLNRECGSTSNWRNPLDIPLPWVPDADTEMLGLQVPVHRPTWHYRVVVDESTKSFVVELIAHWPYQHRWIPPFPPSRCALVEHPNDYEPIFLYYKYYGPDFYSSLQIGSYSYQYTFHTVAHGLAAIPFIVEGTDAEWQSNPKSKLFFWSDPDGNQHPVLTIGKAGESTNWGIVKGLSLPVLGWTSFVGHGFGHVVEGPITFGEVLVSVTGSSFLQGQDANGALLENGFETCWPDNKDYSAGFRDQYLKRCTDDRIDSWSSLPADLNPFKMLPQFGSMDFVDPWNDDYFGNPSIGWVFDPSNIPGLPNWYHQYIEPGTNALDAKFQTNTYLTLTNTQAGDVYIAKYPLIPYYGTPDGYKAINRYIEITTNIESSEIGWPTNIRVYYNQLDVAAGLVSEYSLRLYHWDGKGWIEETSSNVDTVNNYVWAETSHLGTFAIFGQSLLHSVADYLIITSNSPTDILVTDPNGCRVGCNPTSEDILIEIPGASYSGNGSEPQIALVPSPLFGTYIVDILGTDVGTYTISIRSIAEGGSTIAIVTWTGTTAEGELDRNDVQLSEDGNILELPPSIELLTPFEGQALQDGVTLRTLASDPTGVDCVAFSIREPNGDQGTIIDPMFESILAANSIDDQWILDFDTTQLPDGYYLLLVEASDAMDNKRHATVHFSIRNWATIQLLPSTPSNKAGRTMPIKFSIRVKASVNPAQPFVLNEELKIKIYEKGKPGTILQTSTYGAGAGNYRIDPIGEKYMTNFQTLKTPTTYVVDIYRKDLLIGSFEFKTVK